MDLDNANPLPLCPPLPDSPLASPNPKKVCSVSLEENVSNADILNAIKELSSKFSSLEAKINKNSADIGTIKDNIGEMDHSMKATFVAVNAVNQRISKLESKTEDAERYSRRWTLKLLNLPEGVNETAETQGKKFLTSSA